MQTDKQLDRQTVARAHSHTHTRTHARTHALAHAHLLLSLSLSLSQTHSNIHTRAHACMYTRKVLRCDECYHSHVCVLQLRTLSNLDQQRSLKSKTCGVAGPSKKGLSGPTVSNQSAGLKIEATPAPRQKNAAASEKSPCGISTLHSFQRNFVY